MERLIFDDTLNRLQIDPQVVRVENPIQQQSIFSLIHFFTRKTKIL